jgi:hypothetical protein
MPGTLSLEVIAGDVAEFLVDQRNQGLKSFPVARFPAYEQFGHRVRMFLIHSQLRPKQLDVKIASAPWQVNVVERMSSTGTNFLLLSKEL